MDDKQIVYTYEVSGGICICDLDGDYIGLLDSDWMGEDAYYSQYYKEIEEDYKITKRFKSKSEMLDYIAKEKLINHLDQFYTELIAYFDKFKIPLIMDSQDVQRIITEFYSQYTKPTNKL